MKQRVITAVIFGAVLISFTIWGGLPFIVLTYAFASIALSELLRMRKLNLFSFPGIISLLLLWSFLIPKQYHFILETLHLNKVEVALLAVLLLLTYTVITKNRFTFDDVSFSIMSTLYIGMGFYFFMETRAAGLVFIFYALFVIWTTDSGAYLIGRKLGKRKLWPDISPNKTIEGALGGMISSIVISIIYVLLTGMDVAIPMIVVATIFLSIFGQIGDLVESALKRHYNVKDSGNILPGHGGVLDRFDSLIFVCPLIHFFIL